MEQVSQLFKETPGWKADSVAFCCCCKAATARPNDKIACDDTGENSTQMKLKVVL